MGRPRIVIIGAGATGRGQLGQLAHDAGWQITFVERREDLVACLRAAGRYTVRLAGEQIRDIEVDGFDIRHVGEVESCAQGIANADLVATAVLPTNLESTAPTLAAGLALRAKIGVTRPLNVIACENMERSSTTLRGYLRKAFPPSGSVPGSPVSNLRSQISDSKSQIPDLKSQISDLKSQVRFPLDWSFIDAHVGFPDAMVARAVPVPKDDPLLLLAEADQEWSVDAAAIKEPMPRLKGMTLSPNQEAALERKLYIKNTGHFAIGVLGFLRGHALMHEAARDPEIFSRVDAATRESAAAVVVKHSLDSEGTERYRAAFLDQMKSPYLPDDIRRVIREPIRKLAREERLVGPAMLACEQGQAPRGLARVIAATLIAVDPDDPQGLQLRSLLDRTNLEDVLEKLCGIPQNHPLSGMIAQSYRAWQGDKNLGGSLQ